MIKTKMIRIIGSIIVFTMVLTFSSVLPGHFTDSAFAKSKTYEPSETELRAIMNAKKDPSVAESEKQQKAENPEKAVIQVQKGINGELVISWTSDAEIFHVTLTSPSGNPVFTESTGKKSITVKDLNPGETYTFSIVSETNGVQSDEIKKSIKTSSDTDRVIVKNNDQAEAMVSGAIRSRKSTCTFFMKTDSDENVEELMNSAFQRIKNGQYVKNNVSVFFESADAKNYGDFKEDYVINGEKYTKYSFGFSYLTTEKQDAEFEKELKEVENELDLKGNNTDKEKVLSIVRFVQENVTDITDTSGLNNTAYGALINKKATCNGRAALVYRLLGSAGIHNSIATGDYHNAGTDKEKTGQTATDQTGDQATEQTSAAMQHSINTAVLNGHRTGSGKVLILDTLDPNCINTIEFFGF